MKKKGFTLIELLAVIVILAVIALIAVPQVLKIIYKAKLSAAEDSTLGIAYSTGNYVGNFMLKNDGSFPSDGLLFTCDDGCTLDTTNINDDYELNGLSELKFKGVKPTGGIVTVDSDGKNIIVEDLLIGEFVCNYPVNGMASCTNKEEADKNKPLIEPTLESSPSGWSQSKDVTVTFKSEGTNLIKTTALATINIEAIECNVYNQTAICNGEKVTSGGTLKANSWYKVTSNPTLTFTENGSVSYKVIDGTNYKDGGALTIAQIDRTAPTAASFTETHTTNSITVTASGTDNESGIVRYQFSKDNGSTWLQATPQTSNSYTFSGLASGSYNIKVKVYNGTYNNNGANSLNTKESEKRSVTLACNNTTKTVSCSKYCSGYGNITGYRYDTYDCNGNFVSAGGTCYGTCPTTTTTTTTTTARSCQEVYVGTVEHGSCGKNGAYDLICAIYEKTCTDGTISRYTKECTCR